MNIRKFLLLVLVMPLMSFTTAHKYYLSLTQINYISESKSLQITMNVFIDDLEATLDQDYKKNFHLDTPQQSKDTDTYFEEYLLQNFKVEINNAPIQYQYLGHKYEGDVVYFYIEVIGIDSITSIAVTNKVLMDRIPKQQNLIKLNINKTFKSLMLTKDNDKGLLKF